MQVTGELCQRAAETRQISRGWMQTSAETKHLSHEICRGSEGISLISAETIQHSRERCRVSAETCQSSAGVRRESGEIVIRSHERMQSSAEPVQNKNIFCTGSAETKQISRGWMHASAETEHHPEETNQIPSEINFTGNTKNRIIKKELCGELRLRVISNKTLLEYTAEVEAKPEGGMRLW